MARETVAQRNARVQAEREAYQAAEETQYPTLLMDTLERASRLGWDLTVNNAQFVVSDRGKANWAMTPLYTSESQADLEALVYDVESEEERRVAEQARYLAKQTALAKLTKEERELLGL